MNHNIVNHPDLRLTPQRSELVKALIDYFKFFKNYVICVITPTDDSQVCSNCGGSVNSSDGQEQSTSTGVDIDFYLPEESCAIQVAYNLETAEDREIKSLLAFATKTEGVKRLIIVTNEEERTITKDNLTIEVIPVYKYIMED